MRNFNLIIVLFLGATVYSQQNLVGDYRAVGMSGGNMFNIDDAAINTNPSLLGWQKDNYEHNFAINFCDFNISSFSPLADFYLAELFNESFEPESDIEDPGATLYGLQVWDEMLSSFDYPTQTYETYQTSYTRKERESVKQGLTNNNSFKMNKTIFAGTYVSVQSGVYSFKVNTETTAQFKLSETFADLCSYGKTSSYFDTLVLIDGSHLPNIEENYTDSILEQTYLGFSNDTLTIGDIIGNSTVQFLKTRYYSIGWGNQYDLSNKAYKLYLGANLNFIEGLRYIEVKNNEEEIIISNFSPFSTYKSPNGNCGIGSSISFSGTLELKENWLLSVGCNNLGVINWKAKPKRGGIGMFSNGNDNAEYANYEYGVSKTMFFNDQLEEANFNWEKIKTDTGRVSIFRATPANFHLGVKRQLGTFFSIGASLVSPINKNVVGSMSYTLFSLNYELTFKKITLFSGLNNMNNVFSMPIGFSIGSRKSKFELGASIADLLGYFNKNKTNNFSLGFGVKYRIK